MASAAVTDSNPSPKQNPGRGVMICRVLLKSPLPVANPYRLTCPAHLLLPASRHHPRPPRHARACVLDYAARYPAPRRVRAASRSGTVLEAAASRGDLVTPKAAAAASCSVI